MKFADRLKVTSSGTSAASLTLGAAVTGCRTLNDVFAAGEMAVGEGNIPFTVTDGAGNAQTGLYTLTSATQIDLSQILSSSNGGKPVTFSGGSLTVFNGLSAAVLNTGLTNPHDVGFDIIICAGQSNMVGSGGPDSTIDVTDPRVFAWGGYSGESSTYQKIYLANDPLRHYTGASSGMGPATWFGKTYAGVTSSNRKVLLVPVAQGGTALFGGSAPWTPGDGTFGGMAAGGVLYENAIAQANAALAAAKLMYPKSRIVGTIWLQGESDAGSRLSQLQYASALKSLIQGFRTRMNGASNMWFSILGMTGDIIANGDTTPAANYQIIDTAHRQVAAEVRRCVYTPGLTGYVMAAYNQIHYNGQGARLLGCNAGANLGPALSSAGADTTPPVIMSASVANAFPNVVQVYLSEPFDPSFPPQASAYAVGGHTVTSATGAGNMVYLTVSSPFVYGEAARTVTFTAPGSNGLRDLAGNLMATQSPVSITNSVQQAATAVTMTPSTLSGTAGQASPNLAIGVSPTGAAIPNGSMTVTVTDGTTSQNVTLTTAAPTATVNFTEASAGSYTISATNSAGLTNPANVTYTVAAAVGPTFSSAQVANASPSTIAVTMSATLGNSVPPTSAFAITENGSATSKTITGITLNGAVANIAMSAAFASGVTIGITYTQPGANPRLQDANGNPSASFGPSTVTNNVAAAGSSSALVFGQLARMTDTSSGGVLSYQAASTANYDSAALGATSVLSMAGDGSVTVKIGTTTSAPQPMLSLKTQSTTVACTALSYILFAKTSGGYTYFGTAGTPGTTGIAPAQGDYMRMTRTGSTMKAEVSKDQGQTWTQVYSWTGVPTGTMYAQILGTYNDTVISLTSTGFA